MIFRLRVKVITKAKENKVIHEPSGAWIIRVTVPPTKNQANDRVVELIADEFKTAKSNITIVQGLKAKEKVIEIMM